MAPKLVIVYYWPQALLITQSVVYVRCYILFSYNKVSQIRENFTKKIMRQRKYIYSIDWKKICMQVDRCRPNLCSPRVSSDLFIQTIVDGHWLFLLKPVVTMNNLAYVFWCPRVRVSYLEGVSPGWRVLQALTYKITPNCFPVFKEMCVKCSYVFQSSTCTFQ